MKKRFVLLWVALLVCIMCVPTFASTLTSKGKPVSTIIPTYEYKDYDFSYNQADYLGLDEDGYSIYGRVIPIKVSTEGMLYIDGYIMDSVKAEALEGELYLDAACTKEYTKEYLLFFMDDTNDWMSSDGVHVTPGTYYLRLCTYLKKTTDPLNFENKGTIMFRFASSNDRTLAPDTATEILKSARGTYLKIVVPKDGDINFAGTGSILLGTKSINVKLCNSKKVPIKNGAGILNASNIYINTFQVKKGTYYIWCNASSETFVVAYSFTPSETLKSVGSYGFFPVNKNLYYYVKVKPNNTGSITISTEGKLKGFVALCNSKKKALTKECTLKDGSKNDSKVIFAVKKNATYYLRVRSDQKMFGINYSLNVLKEKSGTKLSKAVSVKKNKSASGLVISGESQKDYYKISVTKSQKVNLKIAGNVSSGGIVENVYSDKKLKKKIGSAIISKSAKSINLKFKKGITKNKLKKGTYYIVVQNKDKQSTGNYTIKWSK